MFYKEDGEIKYRTICSRKNNERAQFVEHAEIAGVVFKGEIADKEATETTVARPELPMNKRMFKDHEFAIAVDNCLYDVNDSMDILVFDEDAIKNTCEKVRKNWGTGLIDEMYKEIYASWAYIRSSAGATGVVGARGSCLS